MKHCIKLINSGEKYKILMFTQMKMKSLNFGHRMAVDLTLV